MASPGAQLPRQAVRKKCVTREVPVLDPTVGPSSSIHEVITHVLLRPPRSRGLRHLDVYNDVMQGSLAARPTRAPRVGTDECPQFFFLGGVRNCKAFVFRDRRCLVCDLGLTKLKLFTKD